MAMREKKVKKGKGTGFFAQVISELKKVVYPTPKAVRKNTTIVIATVLIVGLFISLLDFAFDAGRRAIIGTGSDTDISDMLDNYTNENVTPADDGGITTDDVADDAANTVQDTDNVDEGGGE